MPRQPSRNNAKRPQIARVAKRKAGEKKRGHPPDKTLIHDPLENSIPFLLRRTAKYFRLAMQNRMRRYGLGFSHWFFLRALWLEDGISQRELCKRIESAEPVGVTALAGLERAGLIRKVRDKKNPRQILIYITAKGFALRDELLPHAFEIGAVGVKGIPESELEIVRSVLNRIRSNMAQALALSYGEMAPDDEAGN